MLFTKVIHCTPVGNIIMKITTDYKSKHSANLHRKEDTRLVMTKTDMYTSLISVNLIF